jgi:hypothetical protein
MDAWSPKPVDARGLLLAIDAVVGSAARTPTKPHAAAANA